MLRSGSSTTVQPTRPSAVRWPPGARIIFEPRKGKGFAIRAAFRDVEADVYVLADGDGQLPAASVHDLIRPVLDGEADMVVGSRAGSDGQMSPETINNLGNVVFSKILRSLLNVSVTDVLSGYRALSRMLVKSLPLASSHFEIEVELTIKTSQRRYRIREVPFKVRQRAEGTSTHLHVFRDGLKIAVGDPAPLPRLSTVRILHARRRRRGPSSRSSSTACGAAARSSSCRSTHWPSSPPRSPSCHSPSERT